MQNFVAENRGIEPDLFHKVLAEFNATPTCKAIGIKVNYLGRGTARLSMSVRPDFINAEGLLHGGFIVTLADTAMGYAIKTLGYKIVTLELNVNYFAPALLGTEVSVEANVIDAGSSSIVAEAALYNGDNKLAAKSRGTFFIYG